MVEASDQRAWLRLAADIRHALELEGWSRAVLRSTSRVPGARVDMLRMYRRGPRFARTRCDIHSYFVDRERGIVWSHGDALSYPFQRWGGSVPLGLIEPLRRCLCYERSAPVPNRPLEVLRDWNDGEYGERCLALHRGRVNSQALDELVRTARRLDAAGFCSMLEELELWGYAGGVR